MSKTMKTLVREAEANVTKLTPTQAHAAMEKGDLILDVREPGELENEGRIDGALHIPRGILESRACAEAGSKDTVLCRAREKNKRVHVVCASGARAALAAQTLRTMGYDATVVEGGLKSWKDAGLSVDS